MFSQTRPPRISSAAIGGLPHERPLSFFVSHPGTDLQSRFINVLPRIEEQARFYFRGVRCVVHRADCIAETVAVSWKWFCRLAQRGKDATQFAAALANLAARAVRAGRRVGAGERVNDVMSPLAQRPSLSVPVAFWGTRAHRSRDLRTAEVAHRGMSQDSARQLYLRELPHPGKSPALAAIREKSLSMSMEMP